MAIQQLHGPLPIRELGPQPNFLGELGGSFGNLLGSGIGALAQHKMAEIKRNHIAKGLMSLNFSPQEAQAAAHFPEPILREVIKRKTQQPNEQAYLQALQGIIGGGQIPQQGEAGPALQQSANAIPSGINAQQATKLAELHLQKQEKERVHEDRLKLAQDRQVSKIKPYVDKVDAELTNIRNNLQAIDELRGLVERNKDKLPGPYAKFLPAWTRNNPEIEQIERLSKEIPISLNEIARGNPSLGRLKALESSKIKLGEKYESIIPGINHLERRVKNMEKSLIDRKKQLLKNTGLSLEEEPLKAQETKEEKIDLSKYAGKDVVQDDSGQVYGWDKGQNRYRPLKPRG